MDMQLHQILMENSGTFLLGYRQRNQGREEPKALGRAGQGVQLGSDGKQGCFSFCYLSVADGHD